MEQTLSLSCYIIEWMQTFKAYSVKQFTYDRLLTSVKALEGFQITSRLLGHAAVNITYNIYVHLYGDGFDEMYSALVEGK